MNKTAESVEIYNKGGRRMRELIDRQTAIKAIREASKPVANKLGFDAAISAIWATPTVTRMQEESYQRLIGKKVKA